ncbi:hypothetical protein TWF102_004665 [Orbilia oligospora]|uniref:Calcineurin-like phosphoesterase domain-containing protein n=1 Tax=Orbilia oligospora TaxID=2813651 RepID=A0A7C8J8E1_ORBOL|nr:hypothetical protein TWF103_008888 [Orbilia oligospora]KAF3101926.1 hypothetical protein TWF102_004665 [Orbilia oligospora]KAF3126749.1 hypothetical protein TWF594_000880 [Orbilia oligospora]
MVKIQVVSDLHLESGFEYDAYELDPVAPYLALIGDIGNTRDPGLFNFLKRMLKQHELVFFIAGNHEPYHSSWNSTHAKLREFSDLVNKEPELGAGKFIYMNQTRYDLTNEVTILGCVLFSAIDPKYMPYVSLSLNDFYHIQGWTVKDHCSSHESDLAWLNAQVSRIMVEEPNRKIIIFTHYCPTFDATEPKYKTSLITSGFTTDMTKEECWKCDNVKVWAFGHTHYNYDVVEEGTGKRIMANQRGYNFSKADGFDPTKTIEIARVIGIVSLVYM